MSAPTDTDDHAMLVQFLHDRDVECPVCKYNLRMLTSPRCPECGRELRLTVGTLEPFMRAWIALCIVTWASAGIGVLFGCAIARDGGNVFYSWTDFVPGLYFLSCIPLGIAITALRRRLLKLARPIQWTLAGVLAALDIAAMYVLTARP